MTEQTPASPVLQLHRVGVWFGRDRDIMIAQDLDLDVRPGQWHCLAGRSGSGKTSLLRVIGGFTDPQAGHVSWAGAPITSWSQDQRAATRRDWMGYVDQASAIIEGFTTLENVLMPAVPARAARASTVVPPRSWRASLCGVLLGGRGGLVVDRAHHAG